MERLRSARVTLGEKTIDAGEEVAHLSGTPTALATSHGEVASTRYLG